MLRTVKKVALQTFRKGQENVQWTCTVKSDAFAAAVS